MAPHSCPSSSENLQASLNPSNVLHNGYCYFMQQLCPCSEGLSTIYEHEMKRLTPIPERFVSFDEVEEVVEIPSLEDYSPQEIEATWYKKEDLFQIRQEIRRLVRLYRSRLPSMAADMRGLETETTEGSRRLQSNRLKSLYSVLAEQERQWYYGRMDSQLLGAIYGSQCLDCKAIALESAKLDAAAAEEYYHSSIPRHDQSIPKQLSCGMFDPSRWFKGISDPLIQVQVCC